MKLSLFDRDLLDDGPPQGWTKTAAKKRRRKVVDNRPNVFPWKVRLYMNDGSFRLFSIGKLTYAEAAKRRDELLAGADAYKAWLDRGLA